jgi:hypothetical protein
MRVESIIYSLPYLIMVLMLLAIIALERHYAVRQHLEGVNQQVFRWFSLGLLLLFFGLRGHVGWDWTTYYPNFESVPNIFSIKLEDIFGSRLDPGFVTYISLVKTIWNDYSFFTFVNTLIDLAILGLVIRKYSKSVSISCLMFVVMTGFYLETDLLRNAKSIFLFLLSLEYLTSRRFGPYLALNILGWLFHFSSLLFIILYFFLHKLISKRTLLIIYPIGLALYIFQIEYIKPLIIGITEFLGGRLEDAANNYFIIDEYSSSYGITIGFLERTLTFALLIIYYDKLKQSREMHVFINSYVIYFIFFFYFSEMFIIPLRVGGLFAFSYWILYPSIFNAISNKNNKFFFLLFISLYSMIKIITMTDNILYRYDNVIFGIESFQERLEIFEIVKPILFR